MIWASRWNNPKEVVVVETMNYAADFCEILKESRRKALFGVFLPHGRVPYTS